MLRVLKYGTGDEIPEGAAQSWREIALTRGKVALVDVDDYPKVACHKWFAVKAKNGRWYAARTVHKPDSKSRSPKTRKRSISYMHREILDAPRGKVVDHDDRNGLNNRRHNIVLCTQVENLANAIAIGGTSKYRGVFWDKRNGKWTAKICRSGRHHYLGLFNDEKDAARAYNAKSIELSGPFARLNIIEDGNPPPTRERP